MGRLVARRAAVLVLAVGCGAVEQAPADPPPRHHPAPNGFRRHTVREAGISVALPIGFQVLAQRDAAFPGVYLNLVKLDQSFRGPISALASPESPLKLFAFDRVFWHKRSTTAMLVQATYGQPGLASRWMERMRRSLAGAAGRVGPLRTSVLAFTVGPALRAEYRTLPRRHADRLHRGRTHGPLGADVPDADADRPARGGRSSTPRPARSRRARRSAASSAAIRQLLALTPYKYSGCCLQAGI